MKRLYLGLICILGIGLFSGRVHGMGAVQPPTFSNANYLTGPVWGQVHDLTHIGGAIGTAGTDQDIVEKMKWYSFYNYFFYDLIESYFTGLVNCVINQNVAMQTFGLQNNQNIATFFGNNKRRTYGILLHHPQAGVGSLGSVINAVANLPVFANAICATGNSLQLEMISPGGAYNIAANYGNHFSYEWFAKISNELVAANAIVYNQPERTYAGLLLFLLGMMKKVGLLVHEVNSQLYFTQRQKNMYVNSFKDLFNFIADFYVSTFREYAYTQGAERTGRQLWRYTKNMAKIFTAAPVWGGYGLSGPQPLSQLVEALKPANAFESGVASQIAGGRIGFIDARVYKESNFWRMPRIGMPGMPRLGKKTAIAAGLGAAALGGYALGRYYAPEELGSAAYSAASKGLGFIPKAVGATARTIYKIATSKVLTSEEYNELKNKAKARTASKKELSKLEVARARELEIQLKQQEIAAQEKALEEEQRREYKEQQSDFKPPSQELPTNKEGLSGSVKDLWGDRPTWLGGSGSGSQEDKTSGVVDRLKPLLPWGKQE